MCVIPKSMIDRIIILQKSFIWGGKLLLRLKCYAMTLQNTGLKNVNVFLKLKV